MHGVVPNEPHAFKVVNKSRSVEPDLKLVPGFRSLQKADVTAKVEITNVVDRTPCVKRIAGFFQRLPRKSPVHHLPNVVLYLAKQEERFSEFYECFTDIEWCHNPANLAVFVSHKSVIVS